MKKFLILILALCLLVPCMAIAQNCISLSPGELFILEDPGDTGELAGISFFVFNGVEGDYLFLYLYALPPENRVWDKDPFVSYIRLKRNPDTRRWVWYYQGHPFEFKFNAKTNSVTVFYPDAFRRPLEW